MGRPALPATEDRKSTRLNSSHTEIYTLSLHDALPFSLFRECQRGGTGNGDYRRLASGVMQQHGATSSARDRRSEEHTSELQSHRDLHSFPTRRSSVLAVSRVPTRRNG